MNERAFMIRMFASNSLCHGLWIENLKRTNRFLETKGLKPFDVDEVQKEMNKEQQRQTTLHRVMIVRRINDQTEYRRENCRTIDRNEAEVFELTEEGIGERCCKIYDGDQNNRVLLWVELETLQPEGEQERSNQYVHLPKNLDAKERR